MKQLIFLSLVVLFFAACEKEVRNIAERKTTPDETNPPLTSTEVKPVDINQQGFELLEKMQGHWVGTNRVISDDYDWFCFDYRAISASHIFGIFEGGTMGNLFTSFFVANYNGTRTILARNGGVLNGIYRTSYFVLDSVSYSNDGDFYRLVDVKGGSQTMWMELRFDKDELYFNAYTSRLGMNDIPTRHMTFHGTKQQLNLSQAAAAAVGFPKNEVAWDFPTGFDENHYYINPGDAEAKSASFLSQADPSTPLVTLAKMARDPIRIDHHPYLGFLDVTVQRSGPVVGKPIFLYLSTEPLTDSNGYLQEAAFESITLFPEIIGSQSQFQITYLHPGDYFITAIADVNEDGYPSSGDRTHVSIPVTISPEGQHSVTINNINVQN